MRLPDFVVYYYFFFLVYINIGPGTSTVTLSIITSGTAMSRYWNIRVIQVCLHEHFYG